MGMPYAHRDLMVATLKRVPDNCKKCRFESGSPYLNKKGATRKPRPSKLRLWGDYEVSLCFKSIADRPN